MKKLLNKLPLLFVIFVLTFSLSACSDKDGVPAAIEMNANETGVEIIMREFSGEDSIDIDYSEGDLLYITCENGVTGDATLTIRKGESEPIYASSGYTGQYTEEIVQIFDGGSYTLKIAGENASGRLYVTTDPSSHIETIEDFVDEDPSE